MARIFGGTLFYQSLELRFRDHFSTGLVCGYDFMKHFIDNFWHKHFIESFPAQLFKKNYLPILIYFFWIPDLSNLDF